MIFAGQNEILNERSVVSSVGATLPSNDDKRTAFAYWGFK